MGPEPSMASPVATVIELSPPVDRAGRFCTVPGIAAPGTTELLVTAPDTGAAATATAAATAAKEIALFLIPSSF
ncbi:hypothetical protein GCM10027289_19720 [Tsukamurella serpentis]